MPEKRHQAILLPGGVLPASLAYPALVEALGARANARYKELEMYATEEPPTGNFLDREVRGVLAFADQAGFDRFHLVGYSAGGASALAFAAAHPERLMSLTLNEPGWIGRKGQTPEEEDLVSGMERVASLPPAERIPAMVRLQAPGVSPPAPPPGPPPSWTAQRERALPVITEMLRRSDLDHAALRSFGRPVLYTLGGRSHPAYRAMAARLAGVFPDFTLEEFPQRHHFDPPHRAETERFARTLLAHWERA